jgi:LacI family transcriptional regulator
VKNHRKKLTIQDVMEKSGVSISTISRVLSNPNYPVAEATRKKVLKAVDELGYKPSRGSRYSRKNSTQEIGIILPNITNPFYSLALLGIEKEFRNSGYNILLYNSFRNSRHENHLLHSLYQKGIEGVIISSVQQKAESLREFENKGMKLILLDQKIENMECHISFEYKEGAYHAVKHLFDLGHRHICLATTPLTRWTRREIYSGYRQALDESGIPYRENMLLMAENEREIETDEEFTYENRSGKMKAREFLTRRSQPTAVLCVNDMVAFGFIQELHAQGLRVPGDVSVIGFDDIPFAAMFSPALTTVHCPTIEIGRIAAQLLRQKLHGVINAGFGMKIGSKLIVRNSTAPVKVPARLREDR